MTNAPHDPLELLFHAARTHGAWLDRPVDDELLKRAYEIARMAPTAANTQPLRIVFVKTPAARERLRPALMPLNVDKTMSAPVTAILAFDSEFWEKMPKLFPARPDMAAQLKGMPPAMSEGMARQSATLQAGYFILAARALGLDCGPMGGFDAAKVDAEFFPDGKWKTTLLVNVGYGDSTKLFPRNPRLDFEEVGRFE